jgi:hypothetical protein
MSGLVRWTWIVAMLFGSACISDINPLERDAGRAGVDIEVVGCELDEGTGNVTETVEVTSDKEYLTILINVKLKDAQGTVVTSSSTSASNVKPGETYRLQLPLTPAGDLGPGFTCEADLDFATEPIG